MIAQIFLIAPEKGTDELICQAIAQALGGAHASALFLPRGDRSEADYETLAKAVLPVAHANKCAVLLDNAPRMAKSIGADGAHMTKDIQSVREAVELLKPDMIVGAGALNSRDDAMSKGEAGVDYVFFGETTGNATSKAREDAAWWVETFDVPAVFGDPEATGETLSSENCEFIALSNIVWQAPEGPTKAMASIAALFGNT